MTTRAVLVAARLGLLAGLVAMLHPASAAAADRIEKLANTSLSGAAYSRLRNLTYAQCEARCLEDRRCVAFEHYRGGGVVRRSSNCALFSAYRQTRQSQWSDAGIKRSSVAAAPSTDGSRARRSIDRPETARPETARPETAPPEARPRIVRPEPPAPALSAPGTRGIAAPSRQAHEEARQEAARRSAPRAPASEGFGGSARSVSPAAPPPPPVAASRGITSSATESTRRVERSAPPAAASAPAPEARSDSPVARPPAATRGVNPGAARSAAPAAAAAGEGTEWHIVPVFYGTDRKRSDTATRVAYNADRARRLELGYSEITVPAIHKVPNIERPREWSIPYFGTIWQEAEDPRRHFTIKELKVKSKAELLALVRQRLGGSSTFKDQSIVFVHGYNVGFDDALYRTAQISYDLQFDGAAFTYSWPSGSGWTSYPYDRDSAQQAEPHLYEFLQMVQSETGTRSINIIAHSMGNQLLLQVLRQLKRRSPEVSKINQIILAAPDVDRDAFEFLATEISGIARGVTLYAAGNDKALNASRVFAGNRPRAGDVPAPPLGPVVVEGIDTIDITAVSTNYLSLNHSGYAEHSELLTDLKQLFRTGVRPPNLRISKYRRIDVARGVYWQFLN